MNTARQALVAVLRELSALYPSMRLGQLLDMVATLTGVETTADYDRTTDVEMLREAVHHLSERSKQLELDVIPVESLSSERSQLLLALRETPYLSHGPLVCDLVRIAKELNTTLYDIEDDVLLQRLKPQDAVA